MPYFHDKDLLQYVERELIPGLVDDCVAEFYERFNMSLDLSPSSLLMMDDVIRNHGSKIEQDALAGPVGAYLGAVLCRSDGARWHPAFNREKGVDGYQASRLRLYDEEVDVFGMAVRALQRSETLDQAFGLLHRPLTGCRTAATAAAAPEEQLIRSKRDAS